MMRKLIRLAISFTVGAIIFVCLEPSCLAGESEHNEQLYKRLQELWKAQRDAVFSCEINLRRVAGRVEIPMQKKINSWSDIDSLDVKGFKKFVASLDLLDNQDDLTNFAKAFRSDLIDKEVAWSSVRFIADGKRSRIEQSFEDYQKTTVLDAKQDVYGFPGLGREQINIYKKGAGRRVNMDIHDMRFIRPYLFPVKSTVAEEKQGILELEFNGRLSKSFSVDPTTGFVFYASMATSKDKHEVIFQEGPVEYEDGVIWPTVYVKGAFRGGVLLRYEANVVEKARFNFLAKEEEFVYANNAPQSVIVDYRKDLKNPVKVVPDKDFLGKDVIELADSFDAKRGSELTASSDSSVFWISLNLVVVAVLLLLVIITRHKGSSSM